ncbi:hypothetical protein HPB51_014590 [Rhipicephalus microplus]|uniref:C3H1-type domain-containing protein n=1 Tax=Rhipicephalus microplus TaxID=6941 RepID=A0A9J6F509_RHIMP|nr:hypothetical protein HPB51_014590 [Rhipicephalus microplus]
MNTEKEIALSAKEAPDKPTQFIADKRTLQWHFSLSLPPGKTQCHTRNVDFHSGKRAAAAATHPHALVAPNELSPPPLAATMGQVCREFQRGTCKRPETECRFGHPPEHVAVDSGDGAVTVCMDFVKGRCSRDQCRYFHPPPHLQAQLKATQSRAGAAAAAAAAAMLLDTLPVCRDFKSGQCKRPQCRYVHLVEEGKVTVCRDAAKGRCARPLCKYYHVPALSLSPL